MRMGQQSAFCVWFIITFATQIVIKVAVTALNASSEIGLIQNRVSAGLMPVHWLKDGSNAGKNVISTNTTNRANVGPMLIHRPRR